MKFNLGNLLNDTNNLIEQGSAINPEPQINESALREKQKDLLEAYGHDFFEEIPMQKDIITKDPFEALGISSISNRNDNRANYNFDAQPISAEGTMENVEEPGKTLPQEFEKPEVSIDTAKSQWYLEVPKAVTAIQFVGNNVQEIKDFCENGRYRVTQLENNALVLADSERNIVINPGDYVASLKSGFSVYKADDFIKEYRYIERDTDYSGEGVDNPNQPEGIEEQEQAQPSEQQVEAQFFSAINPKEIGTSFINELPKTSLVDKVYAGVGTAKATVGAIKNAYNNRHNNPRERRGKLSSIFHPDSQRDIGRAINPNSNFFSSEIIEIDNKHYLTNFSWVGDAARTELQNSARQAIQMGMGEIGELAGKGVGTLINKVKGLGSKKASKNEGIQQALEIARQNTEKQKLSKGRYFSNEEFKKLTNYSLVDSFFIKVLNKECGFRDINNGIDKIDSITGQMVVNEIDNNISNLCNGTNYLQNNGAFDPSNQEQI